jgi:hypothetical protein
VPCPIVLPIAPHPRTQLASLPRLTYPAGQSFATEPGSRLSPVELNP